MNAGKKIEVALLMNGQKKKWLCEKMGITQPSLCRKLKSGNFTPAERFYINALLSINLDLKD